MGVQVAAGLGVNQSQDIAISNKLDRGLGIKFGIRAVRIEPPFIVGVLVVIAGDLLLRGAFGICLDVGVK